MDATGFGFGDVAHQLPVGGPGEDEGVDGDGDGDGKEYRGCHGEIEESCRTKAIWVRQLSGMVLYATYNAEVGLLTGIVGKDDLQQNMLNGQRGFIQNPSRCATMPGSLYIRLYT